MSNKFNTETNIIRESERILKRVQEGNNKLDMIKSQGSSLLMTLINGEGENSDVENKEELLNCAQLISGSYNEISSIDTRYTLSESDKKEMDKWFKVDYIDLLKYVPDCIKEIKDNSGFVYNNKIKDLTSCYVPFKTWKKPIRIDEGGKEEEGDYSKRGENLKKDSRFRWYFTDLPENKRIKKVIEDIEESIKKAKIELKRKEEEKRAKERELDGLSWIQFISKAIVRNQIGEISNAINSINGSINDAYQEIKNQEKKYESIELDYYYDDEYILQRTVEDLDKKKITIMTGSRAEGGGWFRKTRVVNSYDEIVQDVSKNKRETKQNPILPDTNKLISYIKKDGSPIKKGCLIGDIYNLNIFLDFKSNGISYKGDNPISGNIFNPPSFNYSLRDLKDGNACSRFHDENWTLEYAHNLSYNFPKHFYYEYKGYYITTRNEIELVSTDPRIKEEYKSRYNAANSITKLLVYDKKDFEFVYKDHKWELKVCSYLEDTNLPEELWDDDLSLSNNLSDKAFNDMANEYKGRIIKDLELCKKQYLNSPESNRCEDHKPWEKYDEFIKKLSNYNLSNLSESISFCLYCKNDILSWSTKRIKALIDTVSNKSNIKRFLDVFYKRMRKNTGSLMLWYQSIINFDDVYIDTMLGINIIKEDIRDILVTTGVNQYNSSLFNNIKNPSFIDIENVSYLYDNKDFKVNDNIYIIKNLKIQKNRIIKKEIKEIQDPSTYDKSKKIKITRLHLYNNLLDWCQTDDPTKIIICKLL